MGKYKSRRYKIHASAPSTKSEEIVKPPSAPSTAFKLPSAITPNVFEGIDLLSLLDNAPKRPLEDDAVSVKSHISNKSFKGESVIPKKEKRKLRRQLLLRKIDTVNQLKKEHKEKPKKKAIDTSLGDMQHLLDSLPKLEPLNKKITSAQQTTKKRKAIEKSKKIQKKTIQHVNIYKKVLKNPAISKDPFGVITEHLKAVVEQERKALKEPEVKPKKKVTGQKKKNK